MYDDNFGGINANETKQFTNQELIYNPVLSNEVYHNPEPKLTTEDQEKYNIKEGGGMMFELEDDITNQETQSPIMISGRGS